MADESMTLTVEIDNPRVTLMLVKFIEVMKNTPLAVSFEKTTSDRRSILNITANNPLSFWEIGMAHGGFLAIIDSEKNKSQQ